MFDQTFVDTQNRTRSPWSMAASLTVQTGVVGSLLLIPLLRPEGPFMKLEAPPLIYRANVLMPTRVPAMVQRSSATVAHSVYRPSITVPRSIPRGVEHIEDAPELGFQSDIVGAISSGGSIDRFFAAIGERLPATTPTPIKNVETPAPPSGPLRVNSSVQGALLKFGPKPAYPILAKTTRVQGTVRLTAVVGTDGAIRNLRLISGPPLLVRAAMETVSTWRYQPTLLNGAPVDVITEIDVNFTLSN
jgi:protein TonB